MTIDKSSIPSKNHTHSCPPHWTYQALIIWTGLFFAPSSPDVHMFIRLMLERAAKKRKKIVKQTMACLSFVHRGPGRVEESINHFIHMRCSCGRQPPEYSQQMSSCRKRPLNQTPRSSMYSEGATSLWWIDRIQWIPVRGRRAVSRARRPIYDKLEHHLFSG